MIKQVFIFPLQTLVDNSASALRFPKNMETIDWQLLKYLLR